MQVEFGAGIEIMMFEINVCPSVKVCSLAWKVFQCKAHSRNEASYILVCGAIHLLAIHDKSYTGPILKIYHIIFSKVYEFDSWIFYNFICFQF